MVIVKSDFAQWNWEMISKVETVLDPAKHENGTPSLVTKTDREVPTVCLRCRS